MANNCYNSIVITGDAQQIKDFKNLINPNRNAMFDGEELSSALYGKYGRDSSDGRWLDFRMTNQDEEEEINNEFIRLSGDSAWTPMLEMFTKISKEYSFTIRYEYEEMGCDFAGYADIKNGVCEDNCFTFWEGQIKMADEQNALDLVLDNELECYESEAELLSSSMYLAFSSEKKAIILEAWKSVNV